MIEHIPDLLLEPIEISSFRLDEEAVEQILGKDTLHFLYSTETVLDPPGNRATIRVNVQYLVGDVSLMDMQAMVPFSIPNLAQKYRIEEEAHEIVFRGNLIPDLLEVVAGTVRGLVAAKVQGTGLADYPLPIYSIPLLVEANRIKLKES